MTVLRGAQASLAMPRVREHQVLHVAADLPPDRDAFEQARAEILAWAQKRNGGRFPRDAMAGRSFDLPAGGRSSSAVEVDLPGIHAWALRQEDPDKQVAGRIWISEALLWRTPDGPPSFAARLVVGSSEAELDIAPAAPGYIRQLTDSVGLVSGGRPMSSVAWRVGDEQAQQVFLELLVDPTRRLPVIVVSVPDRTPAAAVDPTGLATALCGLAQVVAIPPKTSWALTERFGSRLSVFGGAVRIYMPGFGDDADRFAHPLWLGASLAVPADDAPVNRQVGTDQQIIDRQIRTHVARFSTRAVRIGRDILPFAHLRSLSREAEQDRLARGGASDGEKLGAAEGRIAAITKELIEAREMERYAVEEESKARLRAEEAESRERNAIARLQNLLQSASDTGTAGVGPAKFPRDWGSFEEWCDSALAGRIVLTSAARRGCKRALYADVEQVARCLLWLAGECRDRFLEGGGSLRDESVDEGIRNSPCGGDRFAFDWQGQRLDAVWHVKTGGNTRAPEQCLRIYYGWHEQTQQIVIAHMPAHRRTGAS